MSIVSASFRSRVRSSIETPVAAFFGRLGFSPNALTLIGFGIAVIGAILAAAQLWLIAGLVVGFGAIFDLFDGALARAQGKTSRFGAFMDSTFDRAGEAVVYIGIAAGALGPLGIREIAGLAVAAMAAAFMVSYTRAKAESLAFASGSGLANVGFAPREVRTGILVVGLVLAGSGGFYPGQAGGNPQMLFSGWAMGLSLGLITILATITTIQRILFVNRQSKSTNQEDTK